VTFRFEIWWMLALLVLPLLVLVWRTRRGGGAWPGTALSAGLRSSSGPFIFRCLVVGGLACLVIAAARPQWGRSVVERTQAGRDIALVIDLSGSMQVDDIIDGSERRDRLGAVFAAARDFTTRRPDDRIGLIFFSSRAITACPPTFDHETTRQFLERMERQQRALWGRGDERGVLGGETNLGLGLAMAARALRDRGAPGRAIILITDGADSRDMAGWIDPIQAARSAAAADCRVYGIGVGDPGGTMTGTDMFGRRQAARVPRRLLPDLGRLRSIASAGNGNAFPATDAAGLAQVFAEIERLEPSTATVRTTDDFADHWRWPLAAGLVLVAVALACEPRLRGVA
jgi:Ca-activated chloride channel family protein